IFLISPPMLNIASGLSRRQYIEGLVFTIISIIAFLNIRTNRDSWRWLILSIAAYALATTAKEVFVPLPLVLFALSPGSLIKRIRRITPYLIITLAYIAYRFYMLGGFGGYVFSYGLGKSAYFDLSAYKALLKTPLYTFQSEMATLLIVIISILLLAIAASRKRVNWWLVSTTVLVTILPLPALLPVIAN